MIEWNDKYNVFNSLKVLTHVPHWNPITNGTIPPPFFVSLDPNGSCDIRCNFCNSYSALNKDRYTEETITKILNLLKFWNTKAVCIGGGGEPYLNQKSNILLKGLHDNNIQIGTITNGTNIDKFINEFLYCKWIGISVDAATDKTYRIVKGSDKFDKVISNISSLAKIRKTMEPELEFKFLITNKNYHEIYEATRIAKDIGCDFIHIRPGGNPWYNVDGENEFEFTPDMLKIIEDQIEKSMEDFDDNMFKVFGIMHKFNKNLTPKKTFKSCYAGLTTCYIAPNGDIGLCVCRRGDEKIRLCHIDEIYDVWGSQKHIDIVKSLDVNSCPNCTYTHVNEIFENVIIQDKMSCYFM